MHEFMEKPNLSRRHGDCPLVLHLSIWRHGKNVRLLRTSSVADIILLRLTCLTWWQIIGSWWAIHKSNLNVFWRTIKPRFLIAKCHECLPKNWVSPLSLEPAEQNPWISLAHRARHPVSSHWVCDEKPSNRRGGTNRREKEKSSGWFMFKATGLSAPRIFINLSRELPVLLWDGKGNW